MSEQESHEPVFAPKGLDHNDEQLVIQLARHPFVIVEANAGAAKTTSLARRIAQALLRGAPPASILALTYTRPACAALVKALQKIGVQAQARGKVKVLTFEQFAAQALHRVEGKEVPLYAAAEQLKPFVMLAVERVLRNPDERYPDDLVIPSAGDAVVEQYLQDFLHLKGTMQLVFEAADRSTTPSLASELGREYAMLRAYGAYEWERKGGNPDHPRFRAIGDATYDLARSLLAEDAGFMAPHPLAAGLTIVAVDEMHDMNRAMFTILKSVLHQNPRAGFVGVGDRDQVIHAVAGADPRFLGDAFDAEIGSAERFPLTGSYRFGPALAKTAGRISRKPYKSLSNRKTGVTVRPLSGHEAEDAIVQAARERSGLDKKSPLAEFAILLRHPYQSIGLENKLLQAGLPYAVAGFESYLFRPEILLVRGLLAYATDDFSAVTSPDTRARILRAMLLFGRARIDTSDSEGKDQLTLEREATVAIADNARLMVPFLENQILRTAAPDAAKRIRSAIAAARSSSGARALDDIFDALDAQHLASQALVEAERVRQVAGNIAGLLATAGSYESPKTFFDALNTFELGQQQLKAKDNILLSSIEAAKGLEFDHVVLPHANARELAVSGNTLDDRNLFYVAITRAKNQLSIYYDPSRPSRYLADAGLLDAIPNAR